MNHYQCVIKLAETMRDNDKVEKTTLKQNGSEMVKKKKQSEAVEDEEEEDGVEEKKSLSCVVIIQQKRIHFSGKELVLIIDLYIKVREVLVDIILCIFLLLVYMVDTNTHK